MRTEGIGHLKISKTLPGTFCGALPQPSVFEHTYLRMHVRGQVAVPSLRRIVARLPLRMPANVRLAQRQLRPLACYSRQYRHALSDGDVESSEVALLACCKAARLFGAVRE